MKTITIFIVIILLLLVIVIITRLIQNQNTEGFLIFKDQVNAPWFRSSPSTRNVSLGLRCEPQINKKITFFGNSNISQLPQYKCLNTKKYLSPQFRRFGSFGSDSRFSRFGRFINLS